MDYSHNNISPLDNRYQNKILELRERAKKELGNRFDIKDFHSVVLMNGVLPLTVLEALVDDYIQENS